MALGLILQNNALSESAAAVYHKKTECKVNRRVRMAIGQNKNAETQFPLELWKESLVENEHFSRTTYNTKTKSRDGLEMA